MKKVGLYLSMMACMACTAPNTLGKLDLKAWRNDRRGCAGVRTGLIPALKSEIPQLKGKSANEIGQLLGYPDVNQLADRNQKFYVYYLDKGPQCTQSGAKSAAPTVAVRISAIGLATEITFQNGIP